MRISDWSSDVCSSDLRRRHASSGGILRGNYRMGHGAYTIGSHPLFMAGRVAYRMLEQPYLIGGLALAAGYVRAWIERAPRLAAPALVRQLRRRSEEHTSELQSLMRISSAVFCLKKKNDIT